MSKLLVQIAIAGDYTENYGAFDWDGKGECPQYWKPKFGSPLMFACNVSENEVATLIPAIEKAAEANSYSNDFARMAYHGVRFYPNKLAEKEFLDFDYQMYENIKSISADEILEFMAVKDDLSKQVTGYYQMGFIAPEPLPYEEYDMM